MTLASAVAPSSGGTAINITLTASVKAILAEGTSGTVAFVDTSNNNTTLGNPSVSNGQASVGASFGLGTHMVQAVFTPASPNFAQSTSLVPNPAPTATISTPSANGDVFAVATSVPLAATFTAASTASPTAVWAIADTANSSITYATAGTASAGNITGSYTFSSADVYGLTLTFTDGLGGFVITNTVGGSPATIVIYDPSAGFVTGGGWIMSGAGAYTVNPGLTGKATFGFVSKYQHGATVPTGDTEFQFQVANFNFHSTSYQWLVIAGGMAQYKGSGTINGTGNYNFLLTARDGALVGNNTPDGFRIKITDQSGNVVYDNMAAAGNDNMTSGNTQNLGAGSVIIHSNGS